ncbi:SH3-containing GRB2-like protein 3-interacting protein 1 isoform X3 [Danio rerio]|uniref:SH3-containing GRB2-like protein 3-interacting protein 1 isoform X3 n=1 Tax=Danio rerio TaxID=7955 RepID=A0A8M3AZW6_DANRE|nr:SH3-containing GRB2-like protein 3-interacting protein 1 isoform X3 [Danio rerio]|eukprot:XP_009296491.1 SH3-containing GRB2-like protein 3-interacting protein 1 isoform X3 [Danio rerio]
MMQGLKKRTRKAFGIRKKEKDSDSTGSPDKEKSKKTNGAPNGFYGEIDWDRYNSPDVDDEGYSVKPGEQGGTAPKVKTFFSSSESEGEEEHGKKFKIKIKPLTANSGNCTVSAMNELKASVGTLAISPSPLRKSPRRSPCPVKRNLSSEEIARPRRSTPTPTTTPGPSSDPTRETSTAFFGPPFETKFEAHNSEVFAVETELWCQSTTLSTCVLSRSLPTGAPPPLPPKNIPGTPPGRSSSSVESSGYYSVVPSVKGGGSSSVYQEAAFSDPVGGVCMPDLDSVFGPVETSKSGSDMVQCSWVNFGEGSPARPPPPNEPAPSPPLSSSPTDSPPDSPITSPLNLPLPTSPPPLFHSIPPPDSPPPPPPSDSPLSPLDLPCCFQIPESEFVQESPVTPASPGMPFPPMDHYPQHGAIPSVLAMTEDRRRTPDLASVRDEFSVFGTSPKDLATGTFRGTPPPLPPPTYRSVMGSPGPGSGPSSPARAGTPLSAGSPIPPLPPRPSSRPKLPPGKPNLADPARPFSPPIHSWSPPPFAPLARAESTSSISSVTSLSAASTPTLGRELNLSVSACSRGPSPLTMGPQDTLPVAAAFTETISTYFKGADPTKCLVKITGEMVLSFPAGITRHFSSHPSPPVLTFTISQYSRLEQVLPNPQLLCCDTTPPTGDMKEFWVNMPNLLSHLKKVAEQRPQATYYNVDMLKYQVLAQGIQSTPLNLAVSWRGDASSTDLRIDYKYNTEAMPTPTPLTNILFMAAVDGGVNKLQAMLPPATWNPDTQKISWKITELSQTSENGGVGALLARFQLAEGPSRPSQLAVQFTSEGSTLSGCDFHLVGSGYRLSLVKKRFSAGKYLADN